MFNALTSEELLIGVGRVLRMAAAARGPLEDYQRSQILSAYSVTRLLAAELAAETELRAWLVESLLSALDGGSSVAVDEARERIASARTGVEVGEALAELLPTLASDDPRKVAIHRVLREMTDRELVAMSRSPELRAAAAAEAAAAG